MRASWMLTLVCALGATAAARAHAPAKVLQYVSTQRDQVIVATNRGLIFGNLDTRDFKLLCNETYGVQPTEEGVRFVRTPSGRLLVSSSDGLKFSDDQGCSWSTAPALMGLSVPSLVQDPKEPATIYVTTYSSDMPSQGTVRVSRDNGETFQILLTVSNEYLRTLLVAGDSAKTLYVSSMVLNATPTYYVGRSKDGGATWERSDVPLTADERDLALLAVNPKEPMEIIGRATAPEPSFGERLLWSGNGGAMFRELKTLPTIMHASFSADGTSGYVGYLDGVAPLTGSSTDRSVGPVTMMTARISQTAVVGEQVLAGGYYQGLDAMKDGVGVAARADLRFERWFDFNEVDEQVQCAASRCRAWWLDWQRENLGIFGGDAGSADAGSPLADAGASMDAGAVRDSAIARDADSLPEGDAPGHDDGGAGDDSKEGKSDDGCQLTATPGFVDLGPLLLVVALLRRRRRSAT